MTARLRLVSLALAGVVSGIGVRTTAGPPPAEPPSSWGDQNDGTYRNPILPADFSDPDAIRVGDDFYMVASDFHFTGMQVLHSRDLVNWEIVGQVFRRLTMHSKYDTMSAYGEGTWAPTIRYHAGRRPVHVAREERRRAVVGDPHGQGRRAVGGPVPVLGR